MKNNILVNNIYKQVFKLKSFKIFFLYIKGIRKIKPDDVVQIGDFITLDSCTHYIPDDTYSARIEKPTFIKEMNSFDDACYEFN